MTQVTETQTISGSFYSSLDTLIEHLQRVRRMTNAPISAEITGSFGYGYHIKCKWQRAKTEEECRKEEELLKNAEEAEKEVRRAQYNRLKEEFDNE